MLEALTLQVDHLVGRVSRMERGHRGRLVGPLRILSVEFAR